MELKKVREFGYDQPNRYVIWTSRVEPGADHDIRSIDAEGRPRWLEVKATLGSMADLIGLARNSSQVLSLIQGAIVMAQSTPDPGIVEANRDAARLLLEDGVAG